MDSNKRLRYFSQCACKALLYEVTLTPKAGLVDCADNGAHKDMTLSTFIDSTLALTSHLERYLAIGYHHYQETPETLFNHLRQEGIQAESSMFQATKGVNTHKGINFSLALILGATGKYLAQHPEIDEQYVFKETDSTAICQLVIPMTKHLIAHDLGQLTDKKKLTYGEKLYLNYGIKGPRGEASLGYPSLSTKAMPFLREKAQKNLSHRQLQLQLLLYLMTFVEDGNLLHRGGHKALQMVQEDCLKLLANIQSEKDCELALSNYNEKLIQHNLSPGGSADLLILSLYFAFLEKLL